VKIFFKSISEQVRALTSEYLILFRVLVEPLLNHYIITLSLIIPLVSPDLSAAITFGVINIFTSAIAVLIAYLTLRYMILSKRTHRLLSWFPHPSEFFCFFSHVQPRAPFSRLHHLFAFFFKFFKILYLLIFTFLAATSPQSFETGLFHRHEHTYIIPLSPSHASDFSEIRRFSHRNTSSRGRTFEIEK